MVKFPIGTSDRSQNIAKNVAYIFVVKGISIIISFLIIPITLDYVSKPIYGIWLTMFSIVSWLSLFDVGLGNGLRNELSRVVAQNDKDAAGEYVSTTYFAMTAISVVLFLISLILCNSLDWIKILKLPKDYAYDMSRTMMILSFFFCLRFVVQLISIIYYSIQKSFMVELIGMVGNFISLLLVFLGRGYFPDDRLLFLVYALCLPPIVVMTVFSIVLYNSKSYVYLRPKYSSVRISKMSSLMNLGFKFFVLQICGLLTYSMTNFLILQFLNADDVTYYNIAYKYFSALLILNNMFCAPLWSAFTEAYTLKDFPWIRSSMRKLNKLFLAICGIGLLMLVFSPIFYRIWLQNQLTIPFSLSLVTMLFILVCCYNGIVVAFINGVGKIRLQTYITIITTIIYIPACRFLSIEMEFGVTGFVGYMFAVNLFSSLVAVVQSEKIIKNRAYGIWNR